MQWTLTRFRVVDLRETVCIISQINHPLTVSRPTIPLKSTQREGRKCAQRPVHEHPEIQTRRQMRTSWDVVMATNPGNPIVVYRKQIFKRAAEAEKIVSVLAKWCSSR